MSGYVEQEFEAYLKCGLLEAGFLRVKCESGQAEKLVAFSCKGRAFCPGRRMAEAAALLVDEVLSRVPIRQWVLSLPSALRYLLATRPEGITQRDIENCYLAGDPSEEATNPSRRSCSDSRSSR